MKNTFWFFIVTLLVTFNLFANGNMNISTEKEHAQLSANIRGNGMCFTPNKGQLVDMEHNFRPDILYKASERGADVYLRKTGISYVMTNTGEVLHEVHEEMEDMLKAGALKLENGKKTKQELLQKKMVKLHRIDIDFLNSNTDVAVIPELETEDYTNFYYPHCPQGVTHVNSYNQVTVKNIYNKIDVKYFGGKELGLKYDIVVNAGGDPSNIRLRYSGAEDVDIRDGKLRIKNSINEIIESIPKVYQSINGEIVPVSAEYKLEKKERTGLADQPRISDLTPYTSYEITFSLGIYNPEYPLVIDPWATYFGGSDNDELTCIATDPAGNPVFTGWTISTNFPVSVGPFQNVYGTNTDAFVAKMNPAGALVFSTYLGGNALDEGRGISCDALGNICVSGNTASANFPVGASGANIVFLNALGGTQKAFLFKFNAAGARLWSTFYGGTNFTSGTAVTTDGSNIILYGMTSSSSGIATAGTYQSSYGGAGSIPYIAKFASNGARIWGTYNSGLTSCAGVSCDQTGNIYVAGNAFTTTTLAGLFKFNPGGGLMWNIVYGGVNREEAVAVAADYSGNVILTGLTWSNGGIATAGAPQTTLGGAMDLFVVKFNGNGVRQWGTYYGQAAQEFGSLLAIDKNDNVYVSGEWEDASNPQNAPISACAVQPNRGGDEDAFIIKYSPTGKLLCITYMGGTGQDEAAGEVGLSEGGGLIATSQNFLYFTTLTNGGYPVTPGAYQTIYGGPATPYCGDAAISQLCLNLCEAKVLGLDFNASTTNVCINHPVSFTPTMAVTCDTTGYRFQWIFAGGSPASSTVLNPTVTYPSPGSYPVKFILTTVCKKDSVVKTGYITVNPCGCVMSAAAMLTANVSCSGAGNGSANVVISNGSGGPYSYSWSNGTSGITTSTAIPLTGLSANTYTVTITEGSCISISTVAITQPLTIVSATPVNVTCNGTNNGGATVTITGGGGPYTFSWSNGNTGTTSGTTITGSGLTAGTYTVTISQGSCISIKTVTLTQPLPMGLGFSTQWASCTGFGTATALPASSSTPYTYIWSNGQSSATATGLNGSTYTVTVTDAAGCPITGTVTPMFPLVAAISGTNSTCTTNGSVSVSVTSGTAPYTYNWSSGHVTSSFTPGPGTYTVTVTDAVGCTITKSITITSSSPVSAAFTQSPAGTICMGALVNLVNAGTSGAGTTYSWIISSPASVSGTTVNFLTLFYLSETIRSRTRYLMEGAWRR
ncbi:MAG: hypothetical protein JNL63_07505 [Bacteroidia bacterium]|nr:hypothetical protein [Bacteroidia bacterium]